MDKQLVYILLAAAALFGTAMVLFHHNSSLQQGIFQDSKNVSPQVKQMYDQWKLTYHKKFGSPSEDSYRLSVFNSNYHYINNVNDKKLSFSLGINEFMDLTTNEFSTYYLGLFKKQDAKGKLHQSSKVSRPDSVDWTISGVVSPIKDQGQCGSCWAFSATGSMESCFMIFDKLKNVSLSEQCLVDCSGSYGNQGCNGGLMDNAFNYVKDHGICNETSYPYKAISQTCKNCTDRLYIKGYTDIPAGNCDALADAISKQPVSVAVDAQNWQFYQSGVFSDCGTSLDHGVLAVGYKANEYWIVKNSWGPNWGQIGKILIAWGDTCGICDAPSYPTC